MPTGEGFIAAHDSAILVAIIGSMAEKNEKSKCKILSVRNKLYCYTDVPEALYSS